MSVDPPGRRDESETRGVYGIWRQMRGRCNSPENPSWPRYGGRGITICARWDNFDTFRMDMGPRPSEQHTLDRIDNDGPYDPENCRWSTAAEQANNRRSNHRIEWRGQSLTMAQWSKVVGISENVLFMRIKAGWSADRALGTPVQGALTLLVGGETLTVSEAAARSGIHPATLSWRLRRGWSLPEALRPPRGEGAATATRRMIDARMAARTHCGKGHSLMGGGALLRMKNGRQYRECRICRAATKERYRQRKRGPHAG